MIAIGLVMLILGRFIGRAIYNPYNPRTTVPAGFFGWISIIGFLMMLWVVAAWLWRSFP